MLITEGSHRGGGALHAIVLAAGASTRFGSPKQLVRLAGRPLLHTVVTRAAGTIVVNHDWRVGLASSIRAGVTRLPAACTGAMLVLADQAAVTADDLKRLAGTWRRQPQCIAAAMYAGTIGVPAIFPRTSFRELTELRGDAGARALLRRNSDRLVRVAMESAAIDLDTPEDLLALDAPR